MSKYCICCEQCFKEIAEINTGAARLWMDLCCVDMDYGLLNMKNQDDDDLKILEENKYILTTDRATHIQIRINGRMETDEGDAFFCAKGGDHE